MENNAIVSFRPVLLQIDDLERENWLHGTAAKHLRFFSRLKVSAEVMKFSGRKSDDLPRYVSRTISKSQIQTKLKESCLEVSLNALS